MNNEICTDRIKTVKEKTPLPTRFSAPSRAEDGGVVTRLPGRQKTVSDSNEPLSEADLQLLTEQLERLKQHLDELPEVDATRVIQIHNRLQSGEYKVDANRVAEKLTALESSLQDPQGH